MSESLEIKLWPHPSLLSACKLITRVDDQLRSWIAEMKQLVVSNNALGLAANQVGLPYRFYVTATEAFINPVLSKKCGGVVTAQEGCLSTPGLMVDVPRFKKVNIHAFNENGEEIRRTLSGLDSRVAQHECDHLEALMMFSHVPPKRFVETGLVEMLDAIYTDFTSEGFDVDGFNIAQQKLIEERAS